MHGNIVPVKSDMNEDICLSWGHYFTPFQVVESFEGSGPWPIDATRAITTLKGRGTKRKSGLVLESPWLTSQS